MRQRGEIVRRHVRRNSDPRLNASTTVHRNLGIHSRASYGQDREKAERLVLLSVVVCTTLFLVVFGGGMYNIDFFCVPAWRLM